MNWLLGEPKNVYITTEIAHGVVTGVVEDDLAHQRIAHVR